ncbi:MAG: TonB-dependent receptor [Candidatus Cloacimonetes bacterium]|nr:TonB-dependent receptor [Candidatus Cloacimonadota bacterium]
MKSIKLILLILVLILIRGLSALDLKGTVLDENGKPVPAVSVIVSDLQWIDYSDSRGEFRIRDLKPGIYNLVFNRIGYKRKEIQVIHQGGEGLIIKLDRQPQFVEGMVVSGTRARERSTPVAFSDLPAEEIARNNYGQDMPLLLADLPNVHSYSDAGSGLGYSTLKVRGFDQSRVGVMINGIPLNDPEDHQVYWVDMPDLAENVSMVQLQRGVGSSLYGFSSFGGSLNLRTNEATQPDGVALFANYGSYETYKYGVKTNITAWQRYRFQLRLSRLQSSGYRDNSAAELWSFFSSMSRLGDRSLLEMNFFGGNEITHAAWYASSAEDLAENHRHNPITYDNEIDDFSQPHLEIHHRYLWNDAVNSKNSFFYIHGEGFYEQYKSNRDLWDYSLNSEPETIYSDLIRQKQVKKNHYGWISEANYLKMPYNLTLGLYLSLFDSEHWGEVKWLQFPPESFQPGYKYYKYIGDKSYCTIYANEFLQLASDWKLMLDLNYQHINYQFRQIRTGNFQGENLHRYQVDYDFFNPRLGLNWNISDRVNLFGNISRAQREPADNELFDIWQGPDDLGAVPLFSQADTIYNSSEEIDYILWHNPRVKSEELWDYELGISYGKNHWKAQLNLFWLDFRNEIVAYGGVDDDGYPITGNAQHTIHRGVELSVAGEPISGLHLSANGAWNDNFYEDFEPYNWSGGTDDFSGKPISGFPVWLANANCRYDIGLLEVMIDWKQVGKQYLDNTGDEDRIVEAYQLMNGQLILKLRDLITFCRGEISLRINNIWNEKYETSGYYDPWGGPEGEGGNYYFPGAGRNYMLGIRLWF